MIAFDTTFLLDYLDGAEATREFLERRDGQAFFAPTVSLFEVYRGAARTVGPDGVDELASLLDWVEALPLSNDAAREAAIVEAELLEAGSPINLGDVLVAGVCRLNGASVVTRDRHFERVEGLDRLEY